MHSIRLISRSDSSTVVADQAQLADTVVKRTKGLLGKRQFRSGEALIIPSCRMVHMFFMRFPIDVVFCSADKVVLAIQEQLRPWQVSKYVFGTRFLIELPAGTIEKTGLRERDQLEW